MVKFLTSPRISRGDFVFGVIAIAAFWIAGVYAISGKLILMLELGLKTQFAVIGREAFSISILRLACDILLIWFAMRRLRDAGYFGWYVLPILAFAFFGSAGAILSIIAMVAIVALPGQVGPNRFGPDPRGWKSQAHFDEQQKRLESGDI